MTIPKHYVQVVAHCPLCSRRYLEWINPQDTQRKRKAAAKIRVQFVDFYRERTKSPDECYEYAVICADCLSRRASPTLGKLFSQVIRRGECDTQ